MKGFWEYIKTKHGSSRLAGDIMMLAGVIYLHWSPLRIISLFWLEAIVMGIFLSYFITQQFKPNFIFAIPVACIISSTMFCFYGAIFKSFQTEDWQLYDLSQLLPPFKPYYETSGILISIVCGHFFESRHFTFFIKKDSQLPVNYIYVFFARFFIIGSVMFIMEVRKDFFDSNIKIIIPMVLLVILKEYLEYHIYKVYCKNSIPSDKEKIPMI